MLVEDFTGREKAFWNWVGDCGGGVLLEWHADYKYIVDTAQFVVWMKAGAAFLRHTYGEPPCGGVLGILWYPASHFSDGRAPIIALGTDDWTPEVEAYLHQLEAALTAFDAAVNWESLPRLSLEARKEAEQLVATFEVP